jgi:hypothetical protein
MSLRSTILAAAAFCAYAVDAHITMTSPVPFVKPDSGPINQAQWPCKKTLGFTVTTMNKMAVGQDQKLIFDGSAVHGGGSCQLSVTTDTEPTENSVWKVIQSIEGGCPGVDKAEEFTFKLPDSIPNGKGTFAWTWFAKLSGGPEMYMNCAPIEVTGGASDTSKFDALPDMLVANLPGVTECKQEPSTVLKIPNPGSDLTGDAIGSAKVGTSCAASDPSSPQPSGGAGAPASSAAGGSPSAAPSSAGGNDGMYTPPAGAGATSAAATSAAAVPTSAAGGAASSAPAVSKPAVSSAAATGGAGGVFAPGASSAAPAASTQTTLVTVTGTPSTPSKTTAAASKPTATAPAAGTGASGAAPTSAPAAGGSSGTCTTNGAVVCNGPTQFGLCNNGSVVWQAVAAGTTCSNGTIQKRGYRGRIVRRNGLVGHVHKH